jgi:hypothetical protein
MTHALTLHPIRQGSGRYQMGECSCGAMTTVHEGAAAVAFETEAPRIIRAWHARHTETAA